MNPTLLKNYTKLSDALLIAFFGVVTRMLTGNSNFTSIAERLALLKKQLDGYTQSYEVAKKGSQAQKDERNAARATLLATADLLRLDLMTAASGNRNVLNTTGFVVSKDRFSPVVVEPLKKFEVVYGQQAGELIASVKTGKGTNTVVYQYTLDAKVTSASLWTAVDGTRKSCIFSSLPVGKVVNVRAGAVGGKNQQVNYCSPLAIEVR